MVQTKWRKCSLVQSYGDFDWRGQFHNLPRRLWDYTVIVPFLHIIIIITGLCSHTHAHTCIATQIYDLKSGYVGGPGLLRSTCAEVSTMMTVMVTTRLDPALEARIRSWMFRTGNSSSICTEFTLKVMSALSVK